MIKALALTGAEVKQNNITELKLQEPSDMLFYSLRNRTSQRLSPFLIREAAASAALADEIEKDIRREPLFMFNGAKGKEVLYLGLGYSSYTHTSRKHFEVLMRDLVRKGIDFNFISRDDLSLELLRENASGKSAFYLNRLKEDKVYIPEVYMPRKQMAETIREFQGLDVRQSGFLLLGESGIGKTTLLAHLAAEQTGKSDIVLFIPLKYIAPGNRSIKDIICDSLMLDMSFRSLLQEVKRMREREERDNAGNADYKPLRFILYLDGINDLPNKVEGYLEILDILNSYSVYNWFKLLYSVRDIFYEEARQVLREHRPSNRTHFCRKNISQGQVSETFEIRLESLSDDEMKDSYEKHCAIPGMKPLSSFSDLDADLKTLMRNPYFFRLVMESYDGKRVPASLLLGTLFKEFCMKKIGRKDHRWRQQVIERLLHILWSRRVTSVSEIELMEDGPLNRQLGRKEIEETLLQLREEKVIIAIKKATEYCYGEDSDHITFPNDRLFEYLLSLHAHKVGEKKGNTRKALQSLIEEARDFKSLEGALLFLLHDIFEKAQFVLIRDLFFSNPEGLAYNLVRDLLFMNGRIADTGNQEDIPFILKIKKILAKSALSTKKSVLYACRILFELADRFESSGYHTIARDCYNLCIEYIEEKSTKCACTSRRTRAECPCPGKNTSHQ
jgi:hypothetical protein